jgi:hypothetical protein
MLLCQHAINIFNHASVRTQIPEFQATLNTLAFYMIVLITSAKHLYVKAPEGQHFNRFLNKDLAKSPQNQRKEKN